MAPENVSRRALAARRNGRLGGLATASTHSQEFLEQRASKAGQANRDRYGKDFYRYLAQQPRTRKTHSDIQKEIISDISPDIKDNPTTVELMQAAAKQVTI